MLQTPPCGGVCFIAMKTLRRSALEKNPLGPIIVGAYKPSRSTEAAARIQDQAPVFSKGVDSLDRTEDNPAHGMPGLTAGLSGRLLLLTVIFVMIAEVLIFVPSVANMRLSWLRDRLNTAAAAGAVIDGLQAELPRSVQNDTLMATGAKLIALRKDGTSRLLAAAETPARRR
ncbi:UNVERIFIED_ORG: hypothetical protein QE448_002193 [Rhizobium sp. SORGH_AS285]|nr:hypothetical protein [Rhizobium sp. SORGH_AS_0285]